MEDAAERNRAIGWTKDDPSGAEFAQIGIRSDRLSASGVCIGSAPLAYRLDYQLETGPQFVTSRLSVTCHGEGWSRRLDLRRSSAGEWSAVADVQGELALGPAGGDLTHVAGALDCDLALSPLTNMMPILRHGLLGGGGPVDFTMAWVAVPSLAVRRSAQRYTHVRSSGGRHIVRYDALDGEFTAEIVLDDDGLVIDYPGIARRFPAFSAHLMADGGRRHMKFGSRPLETQPPRRSLEGAQAGEGWEASDETRR